MTKSAVKPRVLIINDDLNVGKALKDVVERAKCRVCLPPVLPSMQEAVLNEAFDSVLVDANLNNWKPPFRVFGKQVSDGIDFARVYCEFQPKCLIVIFGQQSLPYQPQVLRRIENLSACNVKTLKSPLPSGQQELQRAIEVLKPNLEEKLEETAIIHQANPIFQPLDVYEGLPRPEKSLRQRLLYRRACNWIGKWANFNLHEAGDSSWTVNCGGNFQKKFYGEPLNGRAPSPKLKFRERYPLRKELMGLAHAEKTSPFFFWNTRETDILAKQFDDERLQKIPEALQDDFGIAVASGCAKAYNEGEKATLGWCQRLSPLGQLDAVKTIFKSLNGDRERSVRIFSQRCRKARLNRVVDIYKARLEKIVEKENTAIVELTNLTGDDNFATRFDFAKLRSKGVKEASQCFEFAVYADVFDNSFGDIELTE